MKMRVLSHFLKFQSNLLLNLTEKSSTIFQNLLPLSPPIFPTLSPNLTEKIPSQIFTVLYPKDFAIFETICITCQAIFVNISFIVKAAERYFKEIRNNEKCITLFTHFS